jgi:hypothetical protein
LRQDFGGSNNESLGKDSKMYEFMWSGVNPEAADYVKGMPTYWGDQPIVAAPAYIGLYLLGIIALFIDERKIKVRPSSAITVYLLGKNFLIN